MTRICLLAALAVRHDVVGPLVVALVDLLLGHELVDVDGVGVLELDGVDLLGLDLDEFALGQLIAPALVVLVDDPPGLFVDHLLAQAVAGLLVDLVEPGLVRLAGGRIERHRTGDEGELEIAFPVRARCHGSNSEGGRSRNG